VPHLRDNFIGDKVGHFRGSENPDTSKLTHTARPQTKSKRRRRRHDLDPINQQKINSDWKLQKQRQNRLSSPETTQTIQSK
jgi:hypothetical protein